MVGQGNVKPPQLGAALGDRHLTLARPSARGTGDAWHADLELSPANTAEFWEELGDSLRDGLRVLGIEGGRLTVALLPPLVQLRSVLLPRLRAVDLEAVVRREVRKFFPNAAEAQVVSAVQSAGTGAGPWPVLIATAPAWLVEGLTGAAERAGLVLAGVVPAHQSWAAWSKVRGDARLVVVDGNAAEIIVAQGGNVVDVRRVPASPARIEAGLAETPPHRVLGFAEPEEVVLPAETETIGAPPVAAAIAAARASVSRFELVPDRVATQRRHSVRQLASRMWIAAAAVMLLAAGLYRAGLERELRVLGSVRQAGRGEVAAAMNVRESLEGIRSRLDILRRAERDGVRWTAVLDQVARTLPPDAWLTAFRADGDSVIMEGVAQRAAGVFDGLSTAKIIRSVRPSGAIRQEVSDSGPPVERFSLSARIETP
jgi:hypothetical protein